jgi:hypothetical protein
MTVVAIVSATAFGGCGGWPDSVGRRDVSTSNSVVWRRGLLGKAHPMNDLDRFGVTRRVAWFACVLLLVACLGACSSDSASRQRKSGNDCVASSAGGGSANATAGAGSGTASGSGAADGTNAGNGSSNGGSSASQSASGQAASPGSPSVVAAPPPASSSGGASTSSSSRSAGDCANYDTTNGGDSGHGLVGNGG